MADTQAAIGYGTWMKKGGATPTGFADLGVEITNINPPGVTREAPDATHMTSPDKYREFIAGLMDAGEVQIEYNYVPVVADPMLAAIEAGKVYYQMGNSDWPVVFQFQAICTSVARTAPLDDKKTGSATFKISGKPSLEAAV
jgi:hypothetical protein